MINTNTLFIMPGLYEKSNLLKKKVPLARRSIVEEERKKRIEKKTVCEPL